MPDNQSIKSAPSSSISESKTEETAVQSATPSHPLPAGGWLVLEVGAVCALSALWYYWRRAAIRTWSRFAKQINAEFAEKNQFSPAWVSGSYRGRLFMLETTVSHEDDAPYYHTEASMPLKNSAGFILGVRRKSLLEEVQTRNESSYSQGANDGRRFGVLIDLEDPEFERKFFVITNDAVNISTVLTPEVRKEMSRYSDVELYIRREKLEWRRAGEERELRHIERLSNMLADLAESVENLPKRNYSLSEMMADESLISKGV